MATALPILDVQEPGADLARKTVFIKLHLGLLGNSRKVSSSQVEVDADKELIRVAKTRVAHTLIFMYAPFRHPSRTAGGTQSFRIILCEADAQGSSPGHLARRASQSIQIVQGPSPPTGNFNLHRSMSSGAHA